MSEVKKCPKCSGEMVSGEVTRDVRILKEGDLMGDNVYAFFAETAGSLIYIKNHQLKNHGDGQSSKKRP